MSLIEKYMKDNDEAIGKAIIEFDKNQEFNSHDLIAKISHIDQKEYVRIIGNYNSIGRGFQIVHGLIAAYISRNSKYYNLKKLDKKEYSRNIFRNMNKAQVWKRI